jgi:hypothetical protein
MRFAQIALKFLAVLIGSFCAGQPLALAQGTKAPAVVQISAGDRSPNVNAPGGSVTVNLVDIRNVVSSFDQWAARDSQRIASLLKAGRYDEARQLIDAWAARSGNEMATLAYLKYSQGLVALASKRPVTAEREFAAAVALAPASCEYRSWLLLTLITLDRLVEAERWGGTERPEASACLSGSAPFVRARFLAVRTMMAASAHQHAQSADFASAFALAVRSGLAESNEVSWTIVALTCEMAGVASTILPDSSQADRQLLQKLCVDSDAAAAKNSPSAAKLFSMGAELDQARQTAADKGLSMLTERITFMEKLKSIGELGFAEPERRLAVARLMVSRGFSRRWGPTPDLQLVAADYRSAFKALLPFASPSHPEALESFAFLISYIGHFDKMHPELALQLPLTNEVERTIEQSLNAGYERWPAACNALARFQLQIADLQPAPSSKHRTRLRAEIERCAKVGFGPDTIAARDFQRQLLLHDLDESVARERLQEAQELSGKLLASFTADRSLPRNSTPSHSAVRAAQVRAWALTKLGRYEEARLAWPLMASMARQAGSGLYVRKALEGQYWLLATGFDREKSAIVTAAQALFDETRPMLEREPADCFELIEAMRNTGYLAGSLLSSARATEALEVIQKAEASANRIWACGQSLNAFFTANELESARSQAVMLWLDMDNARKVVTPHSNGFEFTVDTSKLISQRDKFVQSGVLFPSKMMPMFSELLRQTGNLPTGGSPR